MTPNRMLGDELFGNGLKQRVTACRKRLRVNRHQHRLQLDVAQSLFTSEVNAPFPGESVALHESLIDRVEGPEQCGGWIRPEQEIGIT